jgi:hypothetical protein
MNQALPTAAIEVGRIEPADKLDRLLSDFFKAQLKHPWPDAPAAPTSEPSVLVAARSPSATVPLNRPGAPTRNVNNKSRYTLAASVVLLLGTCWYLSNGFQPGERPSLDAPSSGIHPSIRGAGAGNPDVLKELREDKAKGGNGLVRPKLELQ